jgi:hypothetical protein
MWTVLDVHSSTVIYYQERGKGETMSHHDGPMEYLWVLVVGRAGHTDELITFYAANEQEAEKKASELDQGQRRNLFPAPDGLQFLFTRLPGHRRRLSLTRELREMSNGREY